MRDVDPRKRLGMDVRGTTKRGREERESRRAKAGEDKKRGEGNAINKSRKLKLTDGE